MRKISANYIFPIVGKPLKNGIIILNDQGTIVEIIDTNGELKESENLEFYNGILTPGFINAHCHIELSHLKNKIKEHTGLPNFIIDILNIRESNIAKITDAIEKADNFMLTNGIVAVGDISNFDHSFSIKAKSKIKYHTFIEILGVSPSNAAEYYNNATELFKIATIKHKIPCSLSPHAPYSVSPRLIKKISSHNLKQNGILSIHNQENEGENLLFSQKKGELFEALEKIGIDYSDWKISGKNSLPSILDLLPKKLQTLFIHNTFSNQEDIKSAIDHFNQHLLFWTICLRSNLYIENKFPDLNLFVKEKQSITIGTDSLASNHSLSILDELKTISHYFPNIPLSNLLQWATLNGAKALRFDKQLGSFEPNKNPGINLITNIDFEKMKLTSQSSVKVLANSQ